MRLASDAVVNIGVIVIASRLQAPWHRVNRLSHPGLVQATFMKIDTRWDTLRPDPRFVALLKRVGFEEVGRHLDYPSRRRLPDPRRHSLAADCSALAPGS